mmetsp:Transcript_8514/g.21995  ORF Transcript_8514/g.21995 Transcript_8514/m.21995 type:complete len:83 (-) Transcript_8514:59-307(-)
MSIPAEAALTVSDLEAAARSPPSRHDRAPAPRASLRQGLPTAADAAEAPTEAVELPVCSRPDSLRRARARAPRRACSGSSIW